jgi:hypothetical protein
MRILVAISFLVCLTEAFPSLWTRIQETKDKTDNNVIADEEVKNQIRIKLEISERQLKRKMLSKFELSVARCCSSSLDMNVDRCFEVNGFGGIHFLKMPCELLETVLEKLNNINN